MSATSPSATSGAFAPAVSASSIPVIPVTQTNWAPTAKVSAGILAASVTSLVLSFWTQLSAPQAAALTTVITFVIQYLVPERK